MMNWPSRPVLIKLAPIWPTNPPTFVPWAATFTEDAELTTKLGPALMSPTSPPMSLVPPEIDPVESDDAIVLLPPRTPTKPPALDMEPAGPMFRIVTLAPLFTIVVLVPWPIIPPTFPPYVLSSSVPMRHSSRSRSRNYS